MSFCQERVDRGQPRRNDSGSHLDQASPERSEEKNDEGFEGWRYQANGEGAEENGIYVEDEVCPPQFHLVSLPCIHIVHGISEGSIGHFSVRVLREALQVERLLPQGVARLSTIVKGGEDRLRVE